jgi:hypothetical protein
LEEMIRQKDQLISQL